MYLLAIPLAQRHLQVGNVIGGMRGLRAMLWDSSVLDPEEASCSVYSLYPLPFILSSVIRAFASMDYQSPMYKGHSPQPLVAKKL